MNHRPPRPTPNDRDPLGEYVYLAERLASHLQRIRASKEEIARRLSRTAANLRSMAENGKRPAVLNSEP